MVGLEFCGNGNWFGDFSGLVGLGIIVYKGEGVFFLRVLEVFFCSFMV